MVRQPELFAQICMPQPFALTPSAHMAAAVPMVHRAPPVLPPDAHEVARMLQQAGASMLDAASTGNARELARMQATASRAHPPPARCTASLLCSSLPGAASIYGKPSAAAVRPQHRPPPPPPPPKTDVPVLSAAPYARPPPDHAEVFFPMDASGRPIAPRTPAPAKHPPAQAPSAFALQMQSGPSASGMLKGWYTHSRLTSLITPRTTRTTLYHGPLATDH